MITLGGVTLSEHMIWADRVGFSRVSQSLKRTLGGALVVSQVEVFGGRPITLKATKEQGWITKAMVDSVQAMSNTPGGVYTLDIHGEVFSVMFAHHSPPAFEAVPLLSKQVYLPTDYFTATIKLITV